MEDNTYGIRKIGPQRYREDPGRYFEDFNINDHYKHPFGRTITDADNTWFTLLTMNTNQNHFNSEFAKNSPFGMMVTTGNAVPSNIATVISIPEINSSTK